MISNTPSDDTATTGRSVLLRTLVTSFAITAVLGATALFLDGKVGLEKTLTSLVFPLGSIWVLSAGWLLQSLLNGLKRSHWVPGCLWIALTACSSSTVVDPFTQYLESQVACFKPDTDPPLDALVVLGGGTSRGPGRAQASSSGDRVVYAAQLYHQGKTQRLITCGESHRPNQSHLGPAQETVEIWTALNIPPQAIDRLPGHNTYREIMALKRLMASEFAGRRVGILTSATHLPRALRLAQANNVGPLIPVAADYRWYARPKAFYECLPNAEALAQFSRCQKEIMARLVRR